MGGDSLECTSNTAADCNHRFCERHNTKPMESLEDIKNHEKEEILEALKQGTMKRGWLLNELNFFISRRRLEGLIAELIADGECIHVSKEGYSLIQTQEQLYKAVEYYDSESDVIDEKRKTLYKNYKNPE